MSEMFAVVVESPLLEVRMAGSKVFDFVLEMQGGRLP